MLDKLIQRCSEINCRLDKPFTYINCKTRVYLICNIDGHKWTPTYTKFVNGKTGCPKCVGQVPPSQAEIDSNVDRICSEKNYTLLEPFIYKKHSDKIHLKCNIDNHTWKVTYYNLIQTNYSCSKCKCNLKTTQQDAEIFITDYCTKYNYTLVKPFIYKSTDTTRIYLKCNIDGYEWNTNFRKLKTTKCPKCSGTPIITQQDAENIVNDRCLILNYKLDKPFIYTNNSTRLYLSCNIYNHTWNTKFSNFINNKTGCPKCKIYKLEQEVEISLISNKIKYKSQYTSNFLGRLSLDFFLPDYNIAIECQGLQHFKPVDFAGLGEDWAYESYSKIIERDERKYYLCNQNNVTIYYYSKHSIDNYFEKIYTDFSEIIKDILNKKI